MSVQIVLGTLFGDEGKGSLVNHLCKQSLSKGKNPVVIRFSGGPQSGHTVVEGNISHIFSNFGSGTLLGVPTIWSEYCLFEPGSFLNERERLLELGIVLPRIDIDDECHVITPYDRLYNRLDFNNLAHGSCGVGVGATMKRINETPYVLKVADFYAPTWVFEHKLTQIFKYYVSKYGINSSNLNTEVELFRNYVKDFVNLYPDGMYEFDEYNDYIFEGSQGILLDKEIGLFPHVTYADTTSKNAWKSIDQQYLIDQDDENKLVKTYYVSRCYLTRHGNGPMGQEYPLPLINNENETNVSNHYQGEFRTGPFNINLYNWAISRDGENYDDKIRVITCMDQIDSGGIKVVGSVLTEYLPENEFKALFPDNTMFSYGPEFKLNN